MIPRPASTISQRMEVIHLKVDQGQTHRQAGAAVGYNLGGVLGGALTPIAATALAGHGGRVPWGVGAYLTGIALLSLGCFALLPETRPVAVVVAEPVMD